MGTEAAPSSSTFYQILNPGFTQELILPRKFSTSPLMEENMKTVSLVNPNGEAWRVCARRDDQDMYIGGRGWLELVDAHKLGWGFLLIFQYEGNSNFHFRAYDLSTCEITYPSTAKKPNQTPAIIQVDDDEGEKEEHVNTAASSNARSKKGHAKSGANGFEVKLSALNITRGQVHIPKQFRESVGLGPEQQEVTLKDPKGQLWTVGLWRRKNPRPGAGWRVTLRSGWLKLARANNLKAGDRCAFEMVRRPAKCHGMVWEVKILDDHA